MSSGKRRSNRKPEPSSLRPVGREPARTGSSLNALWLPFALSLSLAAVALTPRVLGNSVLAWSLWGAAIALVAWQGLLSVRRNPLPSLQAVLRPQHYVQAIVQISVFAYWGYYWRTVYDHFWLLVAQILFAYCFDMLLHWTRGETYRLGFGPFPIILSINLFLWFRDDWFYMQFLLIAAGFMGKDFIHWRRGEMRTHIFNPSAFALGLFSLVLIATGTTDLTWGQEIASTLTLAPNIYAFLFLVGLVVMYLFSITLVAGTAAVVLFGLSAAFGATTGVPYFVDSEIPAAVFLGLLLLITDPSTSPRTPLGKALFGALYGVSVFSLYFVLGSIGVPTFYDKLLSVPLLNLSVRGIDRVVWARPASALAGTRRLGRLPLSGNMAHMVVWIAVFVLMTTMGKTDGSHPGDRVPFWQQACAEERPGGCDQLMRLEATYCSDGSGWACNELGSHYLEGQLVESNRETALAYFSRACELRFQAGCLNLLDPTSIVHESPHELDLRLLLREGGLNLMDMPPAELHSRACAHGWTFACEPPEVSL